MWARARMWGVRWLARVFAILGWFIVLVVVDGLAVILFAASIESFFGVTIEIPAGSLVGIFYFLAGLGGIALGLFFFWALLVGLSAIHAQGEQTQNQVAELARPSAAVPPPAPSPSAAIAEVPRTALPSTTTSSEEE